MSLRAHAYVATIMVLWFGIIPEMPFSNSALAANGEVSPATAPSGTEEFGAAVAHLLSIKNTDSGVLPALADAVMNQKGSAATKAKSLDDLVVAILAGPDPSVLINKLASSASVDSTIIPSPNNKDWLWGNSIDWSNLGNTLWTLAGTLQPKEPVRAHDLAKASVMMFVLADFYTGWNGLQRYIDEPHAENLLAISDIDFQELKKLVAERARQQGVWIRESSEGDKLIDSITSSKALTVDIETVKEAVKHFDTAFRNGPAQKGFRFRTITNVWMLLNAVKARQSDDSQKIIRSQLEKWRNDFVDPDITRWISQALSRDGPPPGKLHFELKMGPSSAPSK